MLRRRATKTINPSVDGSKPYLGRAAYLEKRRAATDLGNAPMAAAFAQAGYVTFERQIDMTWR